jgi:hypothetical protein
LKLFVFKKEDEPYELSIFKIIRNEKQQTNKIKIDKKAKKIVIEKIDKEMSGLYVIELLNGNGLSSDDLKIDVLEGYQYNLLFDCFFFI